MLASPQSYQRALRINEHNGTETGATAHFGV